EELQVTGLFGEDQAPLLFCDSIVMHEQAGSAVRDRVAANVVQGDGNAPFTFVGKRSAQLSEVPSSIARVGKCHDLPPFGPPSERTILMNVKNMTAWRLNGTLRAENVSRRHENTASNGKAVADYRRRQHTSDGTATLSSTT